MEGFHAAIKAVVEQLRGQDGPSLGCLSDARLCISRGHPVPQEVMADFGLPATILPDLSLTLDGPAMAEDTRSSRQAALRSLGIRAFGGARGGA